MFFRGFRWPSGRSAEAYTPRTQTPLPARELAAARAVRGALMVPFRMEITNESPVTAEDYITAFRAVLGWCTDFPIRRRGSGFQGWLCRSDTLVTMTLRPIRFRRSQNRGRNDETISVCPKRCMAYSFQCKQCIWWIRHSSFLHSIAAVPFIGLEPSVKQLYLTLEEIMH